MKKKNNLFLKEFYRKGYYYDIDFIKNTSIYNDFWGSIFYT